MTKEQEEAVASAVEALEEAVAMLNNEGYKAFDQAAAIFRLRSAFSELSADKSAISQEKDREAGG